MLSVLNKPMYFQTEHLCFLLVSEVSLFPAAPKQSKSLPALLFVLIQVALH